MARKRFVFLRAVEFFLRRIGLWVYDNVFGVRVNCRILFFFLLSVLITIGILPALSQAPVGNQIAQSVDEAQQLVQKGREHYDAEQFTQAVESLKLAVDIFEASREELKQAITLSNLSLAYQELGELTEGKKAITESLKLLGFNLQDVSTKQIPDLSNQQLRILAPALDIYGRFRYRQGRAQLALDSWQLAANIYEQLENPEGMIGSQINQMQALQALGLHQQGMVISEQVKKIIAKLPDSYLKAKGLRSLGNVFRSFGDLEKSEKFLEDSEKVLEGITTKVGDVQLSQDISVAWLSLGDNFRARGNRLQFLQDDPTSKYDYIPWRCADREIFDQEKNFLEEAVKAYQKVIAQSLLPTMQIKARLNLLNILVETKQLETAENLWPRIDLSKLSKKSRRLVYARINLAKSLACLKTKSTNTNSEKRVNNLSWEYINDLLTAAVEEAEELENDQFAKSYALGNLGELYEYFALLDEQHQRQTTAEEWRKRSQQLTQKALLLTQSIEVPNIAYQWEWQLGRLLSAQGKREQALEAYKQAIKTIDTFRQYSGAIAFSLETLNSDVVFNFRTRVEPVYRQLINLLLQPGENTKIGDIKEARKLFKEFQVSELENFLLCNLDQESNEFLIDKFIEDNKLNAAVVYPIILRDKIGVILKLPKKPLLYLPSEIVDINIVETIGKMRDRLGQSGLSKEDETEFPTEIYKWLIKPMEDYLEQSNIKTLVFLLDSPLRNIPMAALYDGQQYLIEKYAVDLTTGLPIRDTKPLTDVRLKALVAAVQDPENDNFDVLKHVEQEVNWIKPLLSNPKVFFDKEKDFTKTDLKNELNLSPYNLVHLATHGQFSSNSKDTFIFVAPNELVNVNDLDSFLQTRDQSRSDTIKLLVLSACATADGDNRAALGLAGIAAQVGAGSILASIQSVSDGPTASFMKQFYTQLRLTDKNNKVSTAEALRLVQAEWVRDKKDPYLWASYVLIGDWR